MSVKKVWYTYDNIHETVKHIAEQIQHSGVKYDAMIAIGGGGFYSCTYAALFFEHSDLYGKYSLLFE